MNYEYKKIRVADIADLVYVTIRDLTILNSDDVKISVSSVGKDKLEAKINGKIYNFTLAELMKQRYSAKGFINLIRERIS